MEDHNEVAIKVEDVTKIFRLPHEKQASLKSALINFRKRGFEKQLALNDVSFEVKKGEFFGIVWRNGSGKSTLLKLLAGIYTPSSGSIHVNGKLTPFIELGVGFNPELTGRENVYLNGALLGFNRKEMDGLYPEIVEFAELERFMDQKLKNYSSGMQVRLAFSIAIRAKTSILLLDEVLAVGDNAFQAKCFAYFKQLKEEKRTVVFVTHDMGSVKDFCDRAMLIENGVIRETGTPHDIASSYLLSMGKKVTAQEKKADTSKDIKLISVDMDGEQQTFTEKDKIKFKVHYKLNKKFSHELGVNIIKNGTSVYERNTKDVKLATLPGHHSISFEAPAGYLTEGLHQINVAAFTKDTFRLIAYINEANKFTIQRSDGKAGGLIDIKSSWKDIS